MQVLKLSDNYSEILSTPNQRRRWLEKKSFDAFLTFGNSTIIATRFGIVNNPSAMSCKVHTNSISVSAPIMQKHGKIYLNFSAADFRNR